MSKLARTIRKTKRFIKKYNIRIEFDLCNNVLWFALQPSNKIDRRNLMQKLQELWGWLEEHDE